MFKDPFKSLYFHDKDLALGKVLLHQFERRLFGLSKHLNKYINRAELTSLSYDGISNSTSNVEKIISIGRYQFRR